MRLGVPQVRFWDLLIGEGKLAEKEKAKGKRRKNE